MDSDFLKIHAPPALIVFLEGQSLETVRTQAQKNLLGQSHPKTAGLPTVPDETQCSYVVRADATDLQKMKIEEQFQSTHRKGGFTMRLLGDFPKPCLERAAKTRRTWFAQVVRKRKKYAVIQNNKHP